MPIFRPAPVPPGGIPLSARLRNYLPPELVTIRIAEVKAGDTLIVSLPRVAVVDQADSDRIEASIRAELKMPEGVNVAVFFGQVDIHHIRKI